jgi:hypothetical protein
VATVRGARLELTFAYSARPGHGPTSNRFDVYWNGTRLDTLQPDGRNISSPQWQTRRYVVTATGSDTIAFSETGTNDSYGTLIDNVVLRRAP